MDVSSVSRRNGDGRLSRIITCSALGAETLSTSSNAGPMKLCNVDFSA
jgi:hypothetical protein